MRYELKSIGIWSFVKISFFLNLILGVIIGFFYAVFMGLFLSIAGNSPLADEWGMDPNEMSIGVLFILFPLLFGIMGAFFQTLLMTLMVGLYNLITKMTGGLVLNLVGAAEPTAKNIPVATVASSAPLVAPLPPPQPEPVRSEPTKPSLSPEPRPTDSERKETNEDNENQQDGSPGW